MTDDWHDLLVALTAARARSLVVGANALAVHGVPPDRIDLLTSITGLPEFAAVWPDRVEHDVRGLRVPFLGRVALIRNELATARRKDLANVEALGVDPDEAADDR